MWDISPRRPRSQKGLQNLFPSIAKNEAWVYNRGVLVVIEDSTGVLVSAAKADSLVHLLPYPSLLRTPTNLFILQCIHGHFSLHSIWPRKSGTAQFQHCRTSNKGNKSCISNITKMQSDLSLLEMSLMGKKKKQPSSSLDLQTFMGKISYSVQKLKNCVMYYLLLS